MTTIPIACTLAPREHARRTRSLSDLAQRALIVREPIDGGHRLTFTDAPGIEAELAAVIAAEASCCAFLAMRLERREAGLVLDITGPADAAPTIAKLFA